MNLEQRVQRLFAEGKLGKRAIFNAAKMGLLPAAAAPELDNATQIESALKQALQDNKAFLALASPTAAQRNSHIEKLTRQQNRIIRLLLNKLDNVD